MLVRVHRPWSAFLAFAVILGGLVVTIDQSAVIAQSPTYNLQLSPQDTFLNIDTTINSSDSELKTYTWPDNRVANAILMKFDLSSLPAGAAVQQATLSLALVESDATSDATYTITANNRSSALPTLPMPTTTSARDVRASKHARWITFSARDRCAASITHEM